ncbi:MAG: hypothetical protein U1E02_40210, partial [Hydrogenophaga sp.]|nr:hypothetical protein [Hydrogenophaga sp.]
MLKKTIIALMVVGMFAAQSGHAALTGKLGQKRNDVVKMLELASTFEGMEKVNADVQDLIQKIKAASTAEELINYPEFAQTFINKGHNTIASFVVTLGQLDLIEMLKYLHSQLAENEKKAVGQFIGVIFDKNISHS